jgi:pyrroline-5-carboxylate reductase
MGFALARSLQGAGLAARIAVYDKLAERCALFSRELHGVTVAADAAAACHAADACFLAVKPQDVATASAPLHDSDGLIISILAGVSLARLATLMPRARLVRVMPNTPCLVGSMAAGFAMGAGTGAGDRDLVARLLAAAGEAHEVPEEHLDAVTGLSGSGPAYFARLIEWLSAAGVQQGLQPEVAAALTVQTALGTALLMQQRAMAPGDLVEMVSSPGGTTVAGRRELEAGAVQAAIERTVAAATARSRELGTGGAG